MTHMTAMTQRFHHMPRPHLTVLLASLITLCLTGCEQPEPVTYQIPKEQPIARTPGPLTTPAAGSTDATPSMQVLPGMQEAANQAGDIGYSTPEGWVEKPASGIRKANFTISSDTGSAEVTVLTFPGEVGGRLANINRWREQIGLDAATANDLPAYTQGYQIDGHRGLFVRLEGDTQSILGALLPFHGNTWFFKMLGDSATVLNNETAMKQFLDSIKMGAHSH
jgi:hypothetical protein